MDFSFIGQCSIDGPVCGVDGQSYLSLCGGSSFRPITREIQGEAELEERQAFFRPVIQCEGECPCCPEDVVSLVCGADGQTYRNSCFATKHGGGVLCAGQCPCHINIHVCYRLCFGVCFTIC